MYVGLHPHRNDVHFCASLFDHGGCTDSESTGWNLEAVQNDRIRCDDRSGADDDLMQHDRTVRHLRTVLDGAALEMDDVADDAVVTDDRRKHGSRVENAAVLNRRVAADSYEAVVTTQNGPRPDARAGADRDASDDRRFGMNESRRVDVGNLVTKCVNSHAGTLVVRVQPTADHDLGPG